MNNAGPFITNGPPLYVMTLATGETLQFFSLKFPPKLGEQDCWQHISSKLKDSATSSLPGCKNPFTPSRPEGRRFQGKSIAPYNNLLIALNISNMCFTVFTSVQFLMYFLWPSLGLTHTSSVLNYLIFSSIASNSWLTAGLCSFYFIKIVQFQSRFLVWLKTMMDRRMPMLIIIVEILGLFESFTALYIFNQDLSKNSTITATEVASEQNTLRMKFMGAVLTVTSPPFLISIFTTAASAVSLKLHNDRMKTNMGQTKVRDYQSAVQTMAGLVVFYALIYFVMILYSQKIFEDLSLGYWICVVILSAFSVVQSGLHIIGNPKLKETLRKIFIFS
ncbi:taste receptor type 2 member 40-like [Rana temporaria]|uniref:taste receptor type 2 member 40-like n=1 Tax=Rana temporaria TaxID=8407 RepID=UPI001AAD65BB|nr:taste receptor type 2 member 40-like [Rana temporaria]